MEITLKCSKKEAYGAGATLLLAAILLLIYMSPDVSRWLSSVTVPSAPSYPSYACTNPPSQFEGKLLYRCSFEAIINRSLKLQDSAARSAWATEWEHKHDNDDSLKSEQDTDRAIDQMVLSLGERFNYYLDRADTEDQNRSTEEKAVVAAKFLDNTTFYLRIDNFDSGSFETEIRDALKTDRDASIYIIDLRTNPGGLLDNADLLAQSLLPEGRYLVTRSRDGNRVTVSETIFTKEFVLVQNGSKYEQEERAPLLVPEQAVIVVLLDEDSASASEIVAGALQANHRGSVVGKPSTGKGVGQTIEPLPFGRTLLITSFEFNPGGKKIDWSGVLPNREADGPQSQELFGHPTKDKQLQAAIEEGRKILRDREEIERRQQEQRLKHETEFRQEREQQQN